MNLIDALKSDPLFQQGADPLPVIVEECEDAGLCVEFDPAVDRSNILIINVDRFYQYQKLGQQTPKTVDCFIIQRCSDQTYRLYLVELKGHNRAVHIDRKALEDKFYTTLFDFLGDKLNHLFSSYEGGLSIRLILGAGDPHNKTLKPYSLDFLLGLKQFTFWGKRLAIDGIPRNPLIRAC